MTNRSICPTPDKRHFTSKGDAKLYLKSKAEYFKKTNAPKIYVYHCPCGAFHFTRSQRQDLPRQVVPALKFEKAFIALIKTT